MNTGIISLYVDGTGCDQYDETEVSIMVRPDRANVYMSLRADEKNPLVGLSMTSDEAQALIASLQAALNALWGNA